MHTITRAELGKIQELKTQSRTPTWVTKTQELGTSPAAFQVHTSRKLESELEPGHEARHSDMRCRCLK